MKIYLAAPWFTEKEEEIYNKMIEQIRKCGYDVHIPRSVFIPNGETLSNKDWARAVFKADVDAIYECDEVWAVNHGLYSDNGTAWECGFAYGIGKPVRVFMCGGEDTDFSLMIANGCTMYADCKQFLEDTGIKLPDIVQK